MYKVQYRVPSGKTVTTDLVTEGVAQALADQAREALPETHELRVRKEAMDTKGSLVWEDVTDQFLA